MKRLLIVLFLLAIASSVAAQGIDPTSHGLSSIRDTKITNPGSFPVPLETVSILDRSASAAYTIVPQADRERLMIYVATSGAELWANFGTTATAGQGLPITYNNPLDLPLGDGVNVTVISSPSVINYSIYQLKK